MPPDHSSPASSPDEDLSISAVLARLAQGEPEEMVTLAQVRRQLGERAFGLMIFVLAIPNCLPIAALPGFSLLTGLGLVFFTLQLCLDAPEPYLPRWLMGRAFSRRQLQQVVAKAQPLLRRVESLISPRLVGLVTGAGERVLGIVALLLSVILLLPIPFANFLPAAALSVFALALISRDGVFSLLGYGLTVMTAWFLPALFSGALELGLELWERYGPLL